MIISVVNLFLLKHSLVWVCKRGKFTSINACFPYRIQGLAVRVSLSKAIKLIKTVE